MSTPLSPEPTWLPSPEHPSIRPLFLRSETPSRIQHSWRALWKYHFLNWFSFFLDNQCFKRYRSVYLEPALGPTDVGLSVKWTDLLYWFHPSLIQKVLVGCGVSSVGCPQVAICILLLHSGLQSKHALGRKLTHFCARGESSTASRTLQVITKFIINFFWEL